MHYDLYETGLEGVCLCVTPSRQAKSAALVPVEVEVRARSSLSLAFRVLLFACIISFPADRSGRTSLLISSSC
jgi:hypothetical protein